MQEFEYSRPTTIAEAVRLLAEDSARPLAGGSDLIPQVREGRRSLRRVVDLKHIPALTSIERTADGGWRLGAATSVVAMRRHRAFVEAHGELVDSADLIGSLQVRSRASLGGNLCNAAPSADGIPLLFALDAVAEIHGARGARRIPAADVCIGPGRTSLDSGELLVALHLPPRPSRSAARYLRFTPRREMDIAIAGSGVRIDLDTGNVVRTARVFLASVGPVPIRAERAEALLTGARVTAALFEQAGTAAAEQARPISDTRGSANYRRDLVTVLTRRALTDCARRLGADLA